MPNPRRTAAAALALALLCGAYAEEPAPAPAAEEKDAAAFGKRMEADLLAGRFAEFDAAFDLEAMAGKVMDAYAAPADYRDGFMKGFKSRLGMGKQIASQLGAASGYKFLSVRKEGGDWRAVFRLVVATGGLNYQEYILKPGAGGKLRIHDLFVYSTGELFSETLARIALPGLLDARKREKPLSAADQKTLEGLKALQAWTEALHAHQAEDAEILWEMLPDDLKKSKAVQLQRIDSVEGEPEGFRKALDDFALLYPGDPARDLLSLDAYLTRKEYLSALDSIERLDKRVGGDPYLNFLRANIYILWEKYAEAKAAAAKAIDAEPALQDAYLSWITATLKAKDFAETAKGLERFEKQFGRIEADLTKEIEYALFLASDAGKAWWKAHEAAAVPKVPENEPKDAPAEKTPEEKTAPDAK
ncbi:MAG: hypothetical protein KIS92_13125 [Planctomycetota bacterium]|nr:hypothetical protein [Planctomycetota bacterium]